MGCTLFRDSICGLGYNQVFRLATYEARLSLRVTLSPRIETLDERQRIINDFANLSGERILKPLQRHALRAEYR